MCAGRQAWEALDAADIAHTVAEERRAPPLGQLPEAIPTELKVRFFVWWGGRVDALWAWLEIMMRQAVFCQLFLEMTS